MEGLDVATTESLATSATATLSLAQQLDSFWQTSPYTAAALVCGFKASAADLVAQTSTPSAEDDDEDAVSLSMSAAGAEKDEEEISSLSLGGQFQKTLQSLGDSIDLKRNLAFLLYGSLYQGCVHEYVFNTLYPEWFGIATTPDVVAVKVAFNLLIQTTLVTLPVAYILKALIQNEPETTTTENNQSITTTTTMTEDEDTLTTLPQPLQSAMDKYWQDIQHQGLLWKCFALWGPVQCLTFSIVPEHYRVTFIAAVSFFWLILLSRISCNENIMDVDVVEKE